MRNGRPSWPPVPRSAMRPPGATSAMRPLVLRHPLECRVAMRPPWILPGVKPFRDAPDCAPGRFKVGRGTVPRAPYPHEVVLRHGSYCLEACATPHPCGLPRNGPLEATARSSELRSCVIRVQDDPDAIQA